MNAGPASPATVTQGAAFRNPSLFPDLRANRLFAPKRSFPTHDHIRPRGVGPAVGHRDLPAKLCDVKPIEVQAFELARSLSCFDANRRCPLPSDPASCDRPRAFKVEIAVIIAAATTAVRKSVRVGPSAASRFSSRDAKRQCQLLDYARQSIRGALCSGGTSANVSGLRALTNRTIAIPLRASIASALRNPKMVSVVSAPLTSSTRRNPQRRGVPRRRRIWAVPCYIGSAFAEI